MQSHKAVKCLSRTLWRGAQCPFSHQASLKYEQPEIFVVMSCFVQGLCHGILGPLHFTRHNKDVGLLEQFSSVTDDFDLVVGT